MTLLEIAAKIVRREYLPSLERCRTISDARAEVLHYDNLHVSLALELKTMFDDQRKLESQVRDLTRPIDGTFVLSAEPTKEEISQARQVIGQLQREVRDLTGEREDRKAAYSKLVEYFGDRVSTDEFASLSSLVGLAIEDMTGLRDNVERLERELKLEKEKR